MSPVPKLLPSHDTGVSATRTRRRFTTAYKLKLLEAAAQCTKSGELGALLRREGLYSSHLSVWRTAARRGELAGVAPRRGPKPVPADPHVKQIADLKRQLTRATARAERLELIVELQKKVYPEVYRKTSPVPYVKDARTPTLMQHGELDRRVPIANAYQLRQALADRNVPVEMVVYKGFGHGITKPRAMRAVMEHNLAWFNHYLWGDPKPDLAALRLPPKDSSAVK